MLRFFDVEHINLKKLFLYSLIISISLSAIIGIGVILFGNFGDLEAKVLATTFTIACMSILGLACGAYLETKRGSVLPIAGIIFSIISVSMWLVMIWTTFDLDNDLSTKSLATLTILAVACSHLSLVSIAKLDVKFQWSKIVLNLCVWILATILFYIIWFLPESSSDFILRIIAVLSIVITALTIVTPVFSKLSKTLPESEEIDAEIERLQKQISELEQQKSKIKA